MLSFSTSAAKAVPSFFAGTGNYYEFIEITAGISWKDARIAALGQSFNSMSGYLATITSDDENDFLLSLINPAFQDGWIGYTDEVTEGVFLWADGPEAGTDGGYSSWNGGEPNNLGGEDYVHFQGGNWNDLANGNNRRGYFVEFSGASNVSEPGTLGLLGMVALGLAAIRRRKRA